MQSTQTGQPSAGKAYSSRTPLQQPGQEGESAGPSGIRIPTDGQRATVLPRTPENRNRPRNNGPVKHTSIARNENSSQQYGFDGVEAENPTTVQRQLEDIRDVVPAGWVHQLEVEHLVACGYCHWAVPKNSSIASDCECMESDRATDDGERQSNR
ncbi:uncharacterized protein LAESUDRAFT_716518 [Laetiporus sulphureus 93-53]|uniref:Uncharacterized protein n=1 Tax=Laetiporus sulphureus 93-53 TaxID=1314785 RepID=A0A165CJK9_9APHY|nr:uncharacterized protein LAESUDRAFT_716518 [Laetiporus sulphureus 93-53]KZT02929.1 hypothetical protein LAESUDRAFT_716518 [Laetiporus sulphureus 93-53]